MAGLTRKSPKKKRSKRRYYLIASAYQIGFIDQVERYLNDGWKLAGGVVIDNHYYTQAVYK